MAFFGFRAVPVGEAAAKMNAETLVVVMLETPTAIANAESRAELAASEARARKLAEEQASLRRVATLVASVGMPTTLSAVGLDGNDVQALAARVVNDFANKQRTTKVWTEAEILDLLEASA